ncbi:hypothetical protein GCM10023187_55440 [Nibrella viscosa]|uniref:Uncharacterized protein n=1 Tax=Nibrella viscosa TaxID=1084524 RepID=A0ABP8L0Q2_9BACT
MGARVLQMHKSNPYKSQIQARTVPAFTPSDFMLHQVAVLPTVGIRVLLALAARLQPDGSVNAPLTELAEVICTNASYANKGLLALAQKGVITKRAPGQYWVNPEVVKPVTATI